MASRRKNVSRRQHARATISDVARRAGVSPMTVSRVINGEGNVRESTRDAVAAAIRALGYSPNKAARSLASASQIQIGLIYDNPSSSFLSAMLLGVLEQAREGDTQIIVVECETEAEGIETIRRMIRFGLDGIILSPPLADTTAVLEVLEKNHVLAVTIGTQHSDIDVLSVQIDDYRAAYTMTEYIIALGHTRIGFIAGNPAQQSSGLRLAGFRDAMAHAGLEVADELLAQGYFTYRSGLQAADELLDLGRPPTAIFASNDDMAAATIAAAHRRRIDIPGALSVCGVDDTLLATTIWPEITTIRQPIVDMSHQAIEMLEKAIKAKRAGQVPESPHLTVDFELIERGSTGPPPVPEPARAQDG
jgi:LacI family transcriptional regulator